MSEELDTTSAFFESSFGVRSLRSWQARWTGGEVGMTPSDRDGSPFICACVNLREMFVPRSISIRSAHACTCHVAQEPASISEGVF